jgi:hypothetical protein
VGDLKRILYAGHIMNKKQEYAHFMSYLAAYGYCHCLVENGKKVFK